MNSKKFVVGVAAGILSVVIGSLAVVGKTPEDAAERQATITFSAAPWDGPAYDIEIPLAPTKDAPTPTIRVSLWGNPEFSKPKTIRFTGKEDSSGGSGAGIGRALFQSILNNSWPENLAGTIAFKALQPGHPVSAVYDLTTSKGKRFKGRFLAAWGNQSSGPIR